jgi:hypothetical protein
MRDRVARRASVGQQALVVRDRQGCDVVVGGHGRALLAPCGCAHAHNLWMWVTYRRLDPFSQKVNVRSQCLLARKEPSACASLPLTGPSDARGQHTTRIVN